MKPIDVKTSTYIDFGIWNNDKDSRSKVGYHARISKYENIFAECYTPDRSEKVFVTKNLRLIWRYY